MNFFYPLMQAYDSVVIKADVELGATEQKFNLAIGRNIQKEFNQEPQIILTLPVLEGTDGKQRMSKSLGNYIGIDEPPENIYGKTMSIQDEYILRYFELVTDVDGEELKSIAVQLRDEKTNPRDLKKYLARTLVRMYYDDKAPLHAEKEFEKVIVGGGLPEDIPEFKTDLAQERLDALLVMTKLAPSKGQARRLIQGGGVSVDDQKISDTFAMVKIEDGQILKVGKRNFIKIKK